VGGFGLWCLMRKLDGSSGTVPVARGLNRTVGESPQGWLSLTVLVTDDLLTTDFDGDDDGEGLVYCLTD
jgi:hypothetical protein